VSHVVLARAAERDLRKLARSPDYRQIRAAITALGTDEATDVVALAGRTPWRRMRVGDWRVLFRPLDDDERADLGLHERGYVIARIVNRRDLERAVRGL
jgi:mRNA-degrading endonuclease RelE of RelBE toxin-antitoxin system